MTKFPYLIAAAMLALAACSDPTPKPSPPRTPAAPSSSPVPSSDADLGAGTPGAFCATSRLGKTFVKDGVTYVCKGPKPYRWRSA